MPYKAQKASGENEAWEVINTESDEVRATHEPPDAEAKAKRQVTLLNEIEKDPGWEDKDDD